MERPIRPDGPLAPLTIVAIDDDSDLLALISLAFADTPGVEVIAFTDPLEALEIVRRRHPHIVLVDLLMPDLSGMDVLERIMGFDPATDVMLMTAYYSTESAVEAIRKGACDYLEKPFTPEQLRARLDPVIAEAKRRQRAQQLDAEMLETCCFEGIVGRSPAVGELFSRIRRAAPYFRTILFSGATGTGKELAARATHKLSPASRGPFVVCNCAAIPENLFESELFGHVRGSFTSASADKAGMFEMANGGSLFLDEIGEIPLAAQAKLLRAVESGEVQRVGATVPRRIDSRIICATNRNLQNETAAKNFREDLYFRISMIEIKLPPLCQRQDDLPLLVRHFIARFAAQYSKNIEGITRRAEAALLRHSWPGNVRELENVIGYACMMTDSSQLDAVDLPPGFGSGPEPDFDYETELISLEAMERLHTRRVLDAMKGNKVRAAGILGISRATLYRLLTPKPGSGQTISSRSASQRIRRPVQ